MQWIMQERVDLARPQGLHRWPEQLMVPGDARAHRWVVAVYRDGMPVDLDGWEIKAYLTRPDNVCVPVDGTADGNAAGVCFEAACYAIRGELSGTLQASRGDERVTLARGIWQVGKPHGEQVADPGELVPTLPELLAQISAMQAATAAAGDAAAAADAALAEMSSVIAGSAPAIVIDVSGDVVSVADAAARPALHVVSTLASVQEGSGTPSPTNIRPIHGWDAVSLRHGEVHEEGAEPVFTADLPETVYGGRLDWTTGVLTVTHVHYRLAVADMNAPYEKYPGWNGVPDLRKHMGAVNVVTGIASAWKNIGVHTLSSNNPQIILNDSTLLQSEWKDTYPDLVVDFVIPINNPYDIQLTPQQLTLLRGRNALSSSTGDTAVTYIADTRLYIDNAVTALAAGMLNA